MIGVICRRRNGDSGGGSGGDGGGEEAGFLHCGGFEKKQKKIGKFVEFVESEYVEKKKREKDRGNLLAEVWGGFDGIYIGENCRLNLFMRQKHIVSFFFILL